MKQANQELVIILPECMENMSVRIIHDEKETGLSVKVISLSTHSGTYMETGRLHTAVYQQDRYEHLPMSEILWIEADGNYCHIHTVSHKKITLSYPLKCIQAVLPSHAFIRIHRSYLVNIDHVRCIIGNSVALGNKMLKIGKGYRREVLSRFIFLGIRQKSEDRL